MIWLALGFFVAALLYSMAGFGGGSTYNALLAVSSVDYEILPSIALICNIIVVTAGAAQFLKAKRMRLADVLPLCALSAPAAWAGGRIAIPEDAFVGMLGVTLLAASLFMAIDPPASGEADRRDRPFALPIAVGGGIGFLSGLVGIGGGVFLAPFLYLIRWGRAHEIAGAASVFILVNSLFGLWGQAAKLGDLGKLAALAAYWPLPLSVLAGGVIGGFVGARRLPAGAVKKVTALLVAIVAFRLLWSLARG